MSGGNVCQKFPTGSRRSTLCEKEREEGPTLGIFQLSGHNSRSRNAVSYEQLGSRADLIEANMVFAGKKAWDLHKNSHLKCQRDLCSAM